MINAWLQLNTDIKLRAPYQNHTYKSPAAPPNGENAMMSFPAYKKLYFIGNGA